MLNDPLRPNYFKDIYTGREYEIPMGKISFFIHEEAGYRLIVENSATNIVISKEAFLSYHNHILKWGK